MKWPLTVLLLTALIAPGASAQRVEATHDHARGYASFVGSWYHHGISLEVTATGHAYAGYRTYVWCGAGRRFACDRIVGNAMYAGGLWVAHLRTPSGATTTGTIYASDDPALDGRGITLQRKPNDFLVMTWHAPGWLSTIVFCGPTSPPTPNRCGA